MATLTVWKFPESATADQAVDILKNLQSQELIKVHDAATVTWEEGKKKPKTRQLASLAGGGALGGAFWGLLFGLLFFVPLLGAAVGAVAGGIGGALTDVGIDDGFINRVKDSVTPGTSALFVLSSDAVTDKVHEAFAGTNAELISSNLTEEQEAALKETFSEE